MHQYNLCNRHFSRTDSLARHKDYSCRTGSMNKAGKVGNGIFMNYTPEAQLKAEDSITKAAEDNENCFEDDFVDDEINKSEATSDCDEEAVNESNNSWVWEKLVQLCL